jgi:hypothetical protein
VGARAVALATGARVFTVASVGNGAAPESQALKIILATKKNVIPRSAERDEESLRVSKRFLAPSGLGMTLIRNLFTSRITARLYTPNSKLPIPFTNYKPPTTQPPNHPTT